jgi:hypothetical protein
MRKAAFAVVLALIGHAPASAQEWEPYRNVRDGFTALFPGAPTVTETTWKTQAGFLVPERVYSARKGDERVALRVIDYTNVEHLARERAKTCHPGAETCLGTEGLSGVGYWKHDVRGALLYATHAYVKGHVEVTDLYWNQQDLVEGYVMQLTSRDDGSRTYVFIAMHEMKLYIAEGTVPRGAPEPALFIQAVGWLDADGNSLRYRNLYSHEIHGLREAPVPQVTRTPAR